ncbi:MAG: exodeoxyribonuclease V subunit gamma, partial [Nitrospiraceae bacterium]|nr:exodeoxyribonuclease V subunit gamma [Nitrospiraceae bacterium]
MTGRFHPHLECSLVDHIRRAKARDPVAPLAVLVPSSHLIERLRRLLAIEQGLSLLNVHLLTFHQLALRLADEAREQVDAAPAVRVADELFFEQLVRHIVRSGLPGLTALEHIGYSSGTWSALWSTVRDLKDAGVDPVSALRGLKEGYFDRDESRWLQALFSLYGAVKQAGAMLKVGTADDLAESLLPSVPVSRFVATVKEAFYYGFYDLTQLQLSFFEALSKTVPTTLFFPLEPQRSFRFAQRFFDRYIEPLIPASDQLVRLADQDLVAMRRPAVAVRSVIGVDEELASTCRQILDLVETNGYRFDDIGVVARTLDPYRPALHAIFERHRVPFRCTTGRPLMHAPLCKAWLQLATLPINNFERTAMLDVVTSPLYRSHLLNGAGALVRPDLWKLTVSALHITKGVEEWARLEIVSRAGDEAVETADDRRVGPLDVPPGVIALFSLVISELIASVAALPVRGTAGQLASAFRELAVRHLSRPECTDDENAEHVLAPVWEALDRVLAALTALELIGDELTWAEFVELLIHAVERTTVQPDPDEHCGVAVLDVMAARGLPFKALFVLGLNDTVFPRYIREDPFLRDRHRRVLDETLGFKIDEKLAGYDEEAVLLALVRQAATDRLHISYQRADDQGRLLMASPYVTDLVTLCGIENELPIEAVPRRLTDRVDQRPTIRTFLPPEELALWMAMDGQDASPLLAAIGREAELFRQGVEALRHLEDERPMLAAHDGMTGSLDAHWSKVLERGLAPTPLERYAHCPFQYFSADVLKLTPVRGSIGQGLDASMLGTVCHAALRRCYERLTPMGWPAEPVTDDSVAWCIHSAVEEAAAEHEARYPTGHYLLWELAKEGLAALLAAAVESDEVTHAEDGFSPVAFELAAQGTLPPLTPDETPILIHGRVDRIDRGPGSDGLRIVDYKFKTGSASKTEDRHLLQAAIRGYRLQPPLYACLQMPGHPRPTEVHLVFLAPNWPTPIVRSTF